jgi:hypothetical protein
MYRAGTFRHSLHSHNNYTHILKNVNNFGGFCTEFAHQNRLQKFFLIFAKKPELLGKKSVYIGEGVKNTAQAQYLTAFSIYATMKKSKTERRSGIASWRGLPKP